MAFVKGQSGNPAGRTKGSKNRKTLFREELERDGSLLAAAIKRKALEDGDSTCLALWAARVDAPLRPRGEPVQFELDTAAPITRQIEQVTAAVAAGDLTLEQAAQFIEMLERLSNVRKQEVGDTNAEQLVQAMRNFAQSEIVRK